MRWIQGAAGMICDGGSLRIFVHDLPSSLWLRVEGSRPRNMTHASRGQGRSIHDVFPVEAPLLFRYGSAAIEGGGPG